jgi:hypothetical protein
MPSMWTFGRGPRIDRAIERHQLVWKLQATSSEMLEWSSRNDVGPPDIREHTRMMKRELAWRRGVDVPFR